MDKLETSQKLIYRLLDGMKAIRYQTSCASNANIYKKVALLPIHPYSIKEEFLQFEEMLNSSDEQYTDFVILVYLNNQSLWN